CAALDHSQPRRIDVRSTLQGRKARNDADDQDGRADANPHHSSRFPCWRSHTERLRKPRERSSSGPPVWPASARDSSLASPETLLERIKFRVSKGFSRVFRKDPARCGSGGVAGGPMGRSFFVSNLVRSRRWGALGGPILSSMPRSSPACTADSKPA